MSTNDSLDIAIKRSDIDCIPEHHRNVRERLNGYLTKNYTLIEKLFTERGLYKLLQDAQIQEASTEIAFRHRLLTVATEFKLQATTEKYDNWLKAIKVEYRKQFASFITEKQTELRQTIHKNREKFLEDIDNQYMLLEKYKHRPSTVARFQKSIESEEEKYAVWLDSLLDNFMRITDENIKKLFSK